MFNFKKLVSAFISVVFLINFVICNAFAENDSAYYDMAGTVVNGAFKDSINIDTGNPQIISSTQSSAKIIDSGECGVKGDNVTWTLDNTGALKFSGNGEITDYAENDNFFNTLGVNVKSVIIEEGITGIGDYTFSSCSEMSSIIFPDTLISIGDYAFESCSSLETIYLPQNLSKLGHSVFNWCKSLEHITINENNTRFYEVNSVVIDKVLNEVVYYPMGKKESYYQIPQGIKSIGYAAFCGAENLNEIDIPDTVENISDWAFGCCYKLRIINIPENVLSIGNFSFVSDYDLTEIVIPKSVKTIGENAFCVSGIEKIKIYIFNPECQIYDSPETICYYNNGNFSGTIYGYIGSTAEAYSEKYGKNFEALNINITTSTTTTTTTTITTMTTTIIQKYNPETDSLNLKNAIFRDKSEKLLLNKSEIDKINEFKALYNKHTISDKIDSWINNPTIQSCYGMTALSLIYYSDMKTVLNQLDPNAANLNEVEINDNLKSKINYYVLSQLFPEIQVAIKKYKYDSKELESLISNLENDALPVMMCYCISKSDKQNKDYKHAVVAYDIEPYTLKADDNIDFFEKVLHYSPDDNNLKLIKTYDPSGNNNKRRFFVNQANNTVYWGIEEYYRYNIKETSKQILLISNELNLINKYSLFSNEPFSSKLSIGEKDEYIKGILTTFTTIKDEESPDVININYGDIGGIGDVGSEIPYIISPYYFGGTENYINDYILLNSEDEYSYRHQDEKYRHTVLKINYPNSLFEIEADLLKSATFSPQSITFEIGENTNFRIHAVADNTLQDADFYRIDIEGIGSDKITLKYDVNAWILSGTSDIRQFDVVAFNETDCISSTHYNISDNKNNYTIRYSPSAKYKIDITSKETPVYTTTITTITTNTTTSTTITSTTTETTSIITETESVKFGDINLDGTIDASDASAVLTYYAKSSTGYNKNLKDYISEILELDSKHLEYSLTIIYNVFGDINEDEIVDANDASLILSYYAVSSTEYKGSLVDFITLQY